MDDLLSEFLTETSENITTLDVELVNLEQNPNDQAILSNIFRLVHTIKGTCGFLGLPRLEKLAHAGENVMDKFRDGVLEVTPAAVTLILSSIDRIKEILTYIEDNEVEPEGNDLDLIDPLNAMAKGEEVDFQPAADTPKTQEPESDPAQQAQEETPEQDDGPVTSDDGFPVAAELLAEVEAAVSEGVQAASQADIAAEMEAERKTEAPQKASVPSRVEDKKDVKAPADLSSQLKARESSVAAQSIRVNVELLENLMTLVSELVLTRNQLLQMVRGQDDSEFAAPLQRLSHITTDLQEGVMKTRMQPIGNAWAKLPRIVRDLCIETGKKIDLQMNGADTELDRQILEMIRDPLTHMVRNSADHGLEGAKERLAVGKPETGIIRLDAYHEGGHIIVEIADDGRGLNIERIREKAIMNGLTTESELEGMSEQQIAQYVFRAGFSTAEKVTSVSGRGVGMDVVKTNIEKIGGTVELKTKTGKGSTFVIKIPLTLAIVSALIVAAGGERFAIPQISVVELVRVTQKSEQAIEMINNSPVLRLRDRLLPLVNLSELLRLDDEQVNTDEHDEQTAGGEETFIVISQVGTYTFGIIVDRVFDTEEIVVKPVAPILRDITMFSGNTILGDGSVIMILDPNGIATATGESSENQSDIEEGKVTETTDSEDKTSLLIFRANSTDLKAVPLGLVARLEEIDIDKVEHSYGKPVVQYRGQLMPLITVDFSYELRTEGRQPILVFSDADRSMGLVVDEIVDIVEDKLKVELKADVEGLIGTAVVNGKATDVIDTGYYLTQAFGDWFGDHNTGEDGGHSAIGAKKLLLVDDSAFFRNLMTPLLSLEGYHVTTVSGPSEALTLREDGMLFDIIVSDIEMPDMDGFSFAEEVRKEGPWKNCTLIALSSHATEDDFARGRDVGFDEYVSKFDRDMLVQILKDIVKSEAFKPKETQNA